MNDLHTQRNAASATAEIGVIRAILDSYDEFGAVLPIDANLPPLAERVQIALGELVHLQDEIGKWGDETFPQSTPASVLAHLKDEVEELEAADTPAQIADELADCGILLIQLAHKHSIDLLGEIRRKFGVNQLREWGEPDERGVVKHVQAEAETPRKVEIEHLVGTPSFGGYDYEWWGYRVSVGDSEPIDYWIKNPRYQNNGLGGWEWDWDDVRLSDGRNPGDCDDPHEDEYTDALRALMLDDMDVSEEHPYYPY